MKNDEIYVIGHKKPDSDSIVSAIAYAYLLNQCGKKAVAGRLGDINEETAYLLDRFGYEEPVLIEDARVRLSEIELKQADHTMIRWLFLFKNSRKMVAPIRLQPSANG